MTDTGKIKAGSGLPIAHIERAIKSQQSFIDTLQRVHALRGFTSDTLNRAISEEHRHLNKLKESLNEDSLPPNKQFNRHEAFHHLCLKPLEYMTKSLRMGDGWALDELRPFVNRCRALVAAYDARMEGNDDD